MDRRVRQLIEDLGFRELLDGTEVTIGGSDPVMPCRYPVGEVAATAIAASGAAAAHLWRLRTGRQQRVAVDVRHAAAAMRGFSDQIIDGRMNDANPTKSNPLVKMFPCSDGRWLHVYGLFPHLAETTFAVLGCDRAEDIPAAMLKWRAGDLEDALADAGGCGAMIRSAEEWAAHPQGQALAGMPVVEVLKIADSAPEPLPDGAARPLAGVKVVDMTRILAGPTCGRTLAEHGADVLLVSSPRLPSVQGAVIDTSPGKLSTHLDLDDANDEAQFRKLIGEADIFSQNYRAGSLVRRGFGPEALAALRPGLIYVSVNCYGLVGPWRDRPGWDQLAQSVTGWAVDHGTSPSTPATVENTACDYATGYLAALGVMVALSRRAREGGSYHVRASLCQTGTWIRRHGLLYDPAQARGLGDTMDLRVEMDTPFGRVAQLAPVVQLSETPARWERPAVPLGTHAPSFDGITVPERRSA